MKISVILAHPDEQSFNHAIATRAVGRLRENGHEVAFHDLYRSGFDPILPGGEIPRDALLPPDIAAHCAEIRTADGIVIVHPNWWGQPPAILKGWVDRVIRPGVAYEFIEGDSGEGVPNGLLKARTALVFNTSNTDAARERDVFGDPLETIWKNCIFGLCGVDDFHRKMFGIVVTSSDEQRRQWLDEVVEAVDACFPMAALSIPQSRTAMIKETFNTIADVYDSPALRFFTASAAHLAASLGLRGDERVIDVATGTGNAALALSPRLPAGTVTGIDFSAAMLAQARQKAEACGAGNVEFVEMDMQEIAPASGGYDVATCAFGIFFVEEMESQLQRIAALVRDGGTIAICNFHEEYFNPLRTLMIERLMAYGVQFPPQTWRRIASEEGCRALFAGAGLGDVTVELKNMGYYLTDAEQWWELIWSAGFRGLFKQLDPETLARFREEHLAEVAALATPDGIWLDVGVYFTRGYRR